MYLHRLLIPNGLSVASRVIGSVTVNANTPTGTVIPYSGTLPPDLVAGDGGDYVYDAATPGAITAVVRVASFTGTTVTLDTTLAAQANLGDTLYFARPNSPLNLGDRVLYAIQTDPNGWTAASLTFQATTDNITFGNLYDDAGNEVAVVVGAAGNIIVIQNPDRYIPVKRLLVRSGPSAAPVAQAATRLLTAISNLRWAD